jgi:hypothetical protein
MSQVQFINDLIESDFYWQRGSLVSACIACLSPEETCDFLDLGFNQTYQLRRAIARQIGRDIERQIEDCHFSLIRQLMHVVKDLPYNKKRGWASFLGVLLDYLPADLQREVIEFILASSYVIIRRKAYRKLASDWDAGYLPLIADAWETHKDPRCAALIIDKFPLSFLQHQLVELEKALAKLGPWYLSRLFLRVGAADFNTLERLLQLDEVSFAYVSAKLQRPLSEAQARQLFERNWQDERAGLLVWSFGQMGLWSVITEIPDRFEELRNEQETRSRTRSIETQL